MDEKATRAGLSYDEIVHKYIDTILRIALSQADSRSSAEDVVQNTFLKLLTSDKNFESEEHLKAWLIRVAINECRKIFASSWFKRTAPLTDDIPFESEEHSEIYYIIHSLPQKYRIPLYLYYYEEYSVREVAQCLGINEGTIKSRLSRGRALIKTKIAQSKFEGRRS